MTIEKRNVVNEGTPCEGCKKPVGKDAKFTKHGASCSCCSCKSKKGVKEAAVPNEPCTLQSQAAEMSGRHKV